MLVIALLLAVVAAGLGFYAQANNSQQDLTLFGATWHTYTWVPAAIAAGAVALICIGSVLWLTWRVRSLERANLALRNDVNLYRLERATPTGKLKAAPGEPERDYVGRDASRPVGAAPTEQTGEPVRERTDAEPLKTFPVEAGRRPVDRAR